MWLFIFTAYESICFGTSLYLLGNLCFLFNLFTRIFWQETLLVHQDLEQSGGLDELILDLRVEGWASCKF